MTSVMLHSCHFPQLITIMERLADSHKTTLNIWLSIKIDLNLRNLSLDPSHMFYNRTNNSLYPQRESVHSCLEVRSYWHEYLLHVVLGF